MTGEFISTKWDVPRTTQTPKKNGEDAVVVNVQDGDMELCFARAHVVLKDWLSENNGGY